MTKIPFIRVNGTTDVEATFSEEGSELVLKGILDRKRELFSFQGSFQGEVKLVCDSCLEEYQEKVLDNECQLWFSDGEFIYPEHTEDKKDVIEFFDGFINFDEVIRSEVESIKLDYHKCSKCQSKEEESDLF